MDSTIVKAIADSTKAALSDTITIELIKIIPGILWFMLALITVIIFYKPIRYEVLPRIAGFKAMGVEFSFVKKSITKAIELAEKSEKWHVIIPEEDRKRVLKRVETHLDIFENAEILWVDDKPDNNSNEQKMFHELKVHVEIATSSSAAHALLTNNTYDLILSDIERNNDKTAGLKFLDEYKKKSERVPFIFYVGTLDTERPIPLGAFGITHRPDELLHLVLDVLERKKYV
jgi:CheY-like chemotaxis protein